MNGFTVIEALVACAVAAVLAAIALPSFASLVENQRRIVTVNALVSSLQVAQHTSAVRRVPTIVCPRASDAHCGTDWAAGWVVFAAPPGWQLPDGIPGDAVLHTDGAAAAVSVHSNRAWYRFQPRGRATNGTLIVCSGGARAIVVSPTGRVRSAEMENDACAASH